MPIGSGLSNPYYAPLAPLYGPSFGYGPAPFGAPFMGAFAPPLPALGIATASTVPVLPYPDAAEQSNRSPAIRAFWLDKPMQPGERSTLFGFTSDYPPVYDDTRDSRQQQVGDRSGHWFRRSGPADGGAERRRRSADAHRV